jgi:hypothetical protein
MTRRELSKIELRRLARALGLDKDSEDDTSLDVKDIGAEDPNDPDDVSDDDAMSYAFGDADADTIARLERLQTMSPSLRERLTELKRAAEKWSSPRLEVDSSLRPAHAPDEARPFTSHVEHDRLRSILALQLEPSTAELSHMGGCDACQRLVADSWREACPSPTHWLGLVRDRREFPFLESVRMHADTDGCVRCGLILRVHSLAASGPRQPSRADDRPSISAILGRREQVAFSGRSEATDTSSTPAYMLTRHDGCLAAVSRRGEDAILRVEVPTGQGVAASRVVKVFVAGVVNVGETVEFDEYALPLSARGEGLYGELRLGSHETLSARFGPRVFIAVEV